MKFFLLPFLFLSISLSAQMEDIFADEFHNEIDSLVFNGWKSGTKQIKVKIKFEFDDGNSLKRKLKWKFINDSAVIETRYHYQTYCIIHNGEILEYDTINHKFVGYESWQERDSSDFHITENSYIYNDSIHILTKIVIDPSGKNRTIYKQEIYHPSYYSVEHDYGDTIQKMVFYKIEKNDTTLNSNLFIRHVSSPNLDLKSDTVINVFYNYPEKGKTTTDVSIEDIEYIRKKSGRLVMIKKTERSVGTYRDNSSYDHTRVYTMSIKCKKRKST